MRVGASRPKCQVGNVNVGPRAGPRPVGLAVAPPERLLCTYQQTRDGRSHATCRGLRHAYGAASRLRRGRVGRARGDAERRPTRERARASRRPGAMPGRRGRAGAEREARSAAGDARIPIRVHMWVLDIAFKTHVYLHTYTRGARTPHGRSPPNNTFRRGAGGYHPLFALCLAKPNLQHLDLVYDCRQPRGASLYTIHQMRTPCAPLSSSAGAAPAAGPPPPCEVILCFFWNSSASFCLVPSNSVIFAMVSEI